MAGKFEINQEILDRDHGKIFLYQRSDHKKPKWQARIHIPGAKGLKPFSTKTFDKSVAWNFAIESYQRHVDALRKTGSATPNTFCDVAEQWFIHLKNSDNPESRVDDHESRIRNYPMVFWKDAYISEISDADIIKFVNWRKNHGRKKSHPSVSTIKRDLVPLKLLFRWAYGEKLIGHKLNFDKIPTPSARRPHFEDDEWDELIKKTDDWIKLVQGKHKRHVRSRTYLKHYIHILGYTGIRPGTEVQSITWRSIKKKVLSNHSKTAYIVHISKGKTGPRTIILNAELNDHIDALKQFRKKELSKAGKAFNRDEAVFCNFDGTPTHSFKGGFATFLKKYNLQNNFAGKKRVPYSLRHTFATRMIGYSTNHWDLAKYMGTSVALLEKNYVHNNRETIGSKFFDPDPNKGQVLRLEKESVDDVLQGLLNQPNIEL